jgi:hypothetical protein
MRVTFEVWRDENDPQIHMRMTEGPYTDPVVVDARANYSGGNSKLYKALDALLRSHGDTPTGLTGGATA